MFFKTEDEVKKEHNPIIRHTGSLSPVTSRIQPSLQLPAPLQASVGFRSHKTCHQSSISNIRQHLTLTKPPRKTKLKGPKLIHFLESRNLNGTQDLLLWGEFFLKTSQRMMQTEVSDEVMHRGRGEHSPRLRRLGQIKKRIDQRLRKVEVFKQYN